MTSRLDVRRHAAAIARRLQAPVDPCVYMVTSGASQEENTISLPIARGPFVAFDGYCSPVTTGDPIELYSAQRPITWPHPGGAVTTGIDAVGVQSWVLFPVAAVGSGITEVQLDGWPAPVFLGAGSRLRIRRLRPLSEKVYAIAGFHTAQGAWNAIHDAMGELRAFCLKRKRLATIADRDQFSMPSPITLHYSYASGGQDNKRLYLYLENKVLADETRTVLLGNSGFIGIPSVSSPASVIGPREMRLNAAAVCGWGATAEDDDVLTEFLGVVRDDNI